MLAASAFLGVDQLDALSKITDKDRRYLAMTYYLRARSPIAERWSWTNEEIKAYERSTEYTQALAEIEKITTRFSTDNPGYLLRANTRSRSIEEQLLLWQTESSVGSAAAELRAHALATLADRSYAAEPDEASVRRFRDFLNGWRPSRRTTVMAPGLSLHGRGRAYDFQILDKAGRTIADTRSSTVAAVWQDQGWSEKLSQAVHAASSRFTGPLENPNEPWHYEYQPDP
ncbi:MAG TPA: hypothetical protein VN634_19480 [Candidatus Limnocylindrales bacterium]|nr:hypothetical protein [Candidatus Limnocylindrales bacterium]